MCVPLQARTIVAPLRETPAAARAPRWGCRAEVDPTSPVAISSRVVVAVSMKEKVNLLLRNYKCPRQQNE